LRDQPMASVRSLYLPVENLARELDGKLLLALVARERGWRPVIGHKAAIRGRRSILPPGVYLAHNARTGKAVFFERFGRFGHQSVVLDEEALVRQTDDLFLMKHERNAFDKVSLLLTWGEDDAELWRKSGRIERERIVATGNPRMDVLRRDLRAFHRPEIDAIGKRFGDYVLLNTNFPTVNHYVAWSSTLKLASWATDKQIIKQKSEFLSHKRALFERFQSLVPKIAQAIAPLRLVVRPHPSERDEPWLDAVSDSPNASVVFEGSVVPWIAGAGALVHNGCTSAVESAVIGTPILSYRPVQSGIFDNRLPNGLGIECFDDDALIGALQGILAGGPCPLTPGQSKMLERHIAATSGKLSCERIIDALDQLPVAGESVADPGYFEWCRRYLKIQWRTKSRRFGDTLSADGRIRLAYAGRKFPEITPQYLDDRIGRFQQSLDRFHGLQAKRMAANLFAIR
ncbi:MAG: hypothetical protein O6844_01615, partial [Gammaproteobacteria bacterium]|nr:hypothetical protein [Gammaproteobacteria bacterium]